MVRPLDLIEIDIEASRVKCKELLDFMADKPFMKDKLNFILLTLNEKNNALQGIINAQQNELRLINAGIDQLENVMEIHERTKSEILKDGFIALYQIQERNGKY